MASPASYNLIPSSRAPAPVTASTRRFSLRAMLVAAVVTVACVAFIAMRVTRVSPYPFSSAQERNMEAFNRYSMPVMLAPIYAPQVFAPVASTADSYIPNARAAPPAPTFEHLKTRSALFDAHAATAPAPAMDMMNARAALFNAPVAAPIGMPEPVRAPAVLSPLAAI